jgi:hypothetical protein
LESGKRSLLSTFSIPLVAIRTPPEQLGYTALLLLLRKISIHGSGADGFGWLNRYWNQDVPFSHAPFGGYLVMRLDGYTRSDAEASGRPPSPIFNLPFPC